MSAATIVFQQQARRIAPRPVVGPLVGSETLCFTCEQVADIVGCGAENAEMHWPEVAQALVDQGLTDPWCVIAAVATIGTEVDTFCPINEYGDDAYFESMYGPGTTAGQELGNVFPGDGARYHGRGFIQLTGRANYRYYGRQLGLPLEDNPELALDPGVAARVLALYFIDRGIPEAARNGDWEQVRRLVNGGLNGWDRFSGLVRQLEGLPTTTQGG